MTPAGGSDRRTPPVRSELALRTLSGIVLAAVAIGATVVGGPLFAAFWLAAAIAVAAEWITITGATPRVPLAACAGAGLLVMVAADALGYPPDRIALAAAITGAALAALGRDRSARMLGVAGFAYAALALVPVLVRERPDLGVAAIVWMFAVVWTTDVAAYFVGRAVGGPKLWARVSPKKTWSGFLGGVAGATVAGTAVVALAPRFGAAPAPFGLAVAAVLSAVAAAASQGGDLAESALKRRCDVKDSGRLIPGHGGAMDRLDGFLAVCLLVALALAGSRMAAR